MEKFCVFFEVRTECLNIMRSLHDVHEMNAYRAGPIFLSAWFNSKIAGRIRMKFGMDVMPLGTTVKS
jgi:hypothetical protein